MKKQLCSPILQIGWCVLILLCAGPALADIDVTGRWFVKVERSSNISFPQSHVDHWNLTQTGTTVGFLATSVVGTIDLTSRIVFFPPAPCNDPQTCAIYLICGVYPSGLTLQVSADGTTFTGSEYFDIPHFNVPVGIFCEQVTVTYTGWRCGGGVVDPGEQCDDGNRIDTDACTNSCKVNVCGDGIIYAGVEECDDGNTADADGCSAQCQREYIPGGGSRGSDCLHEWVTSPVAPHRADGLPDKRLTCTDDDPSCDFGAASGDGTCTFHIGMCFNVPDPTMACTASGVHTMRFVHPRLGGREPFAAVNRTALDAALAAIGGTAQGRCVSRTPTVGIPCATDAECDSPAGSGNGVCPRLVTFGAGLSAANACTGFTAIRVPSGHTSSLVVRVQAASVASSPLEDTDRLTLKCRPAP